MFTFKFWFFCFYLNIWRKLNTIFYSQTNKQTKCQNQTIEVYLQAYYNETQNNWTKLLFINKFSYNNSKYAVTQITLFYANEK